MLTFSFVPLAHAQEGGVWYSQNFQEWYSKVYDSDTSQEIFGERYTAAQVQWVIYGFLSFLIRLPGNEKALECMLEPGVDINDCGDAIQEAVEGLLTPQEQGSAGDQSTLATVFTMRPVSAISYFRDIISKFKLVPEAKAQGFGFSAANPVLTIWRVSRNITYTLLVLVVIVMAFMIMFRVKISPQVVISVQSALPKVVITIILITFSYAIAGFLIDLMYVVLGLLSLFVAQSGLSSHNSIQIFNSLAREQGVFSMLFVYWLLFISAAISSIFSGNIASAAVSIFLTIFAILSIVLLLFFFVKIIILLLKTYVMIMLSIIIGPVQILLGAVSPGVGGFGAWLRTMASHLAVYPVVALLFMLALLFLNGAVPDAIYSTLSPSAPFGFNTGGLQGNPWDPPFTFGTVAGADILWIVLSFAIIALIPKTAEIIQGVISGKPFPYGTAIGEAFGPAKYGAITYGYRTAEVLQRGGELPRPIGFLKPFIPTGWDKAIGQGLETFLKGNR